MFCNEPIRKVYIGQPEYNWNDTGNAFLDCYHDIAYHCTDGYRLLLETENYAFLFLQKVSSRNQKKIHTKNPENGYKTALKSSPVMRMSRGLISNTHYSSMKG